MRRKRPKYRPNPPLAEERKPTPLVVPANDGRPRFADIKPYTSHSGYSVDVEWQRLEGWLAGMKEDCGVDLDPDFQRGHVWTEEKQIAYVEHVLRQGRSARDILWNSVGWQHNGSLPPETLVLVDGKQRIEAVRRFTRDEIPAFGHRKSEYSDSFRLTRASFKMHVNDLPTRLMVLVWYLEINAGGVVHTKEELDKVRSLIETEKQAHHES